MLLTNNKMKVAPCHFFCLLRVNDLVNGALWSRAVSKCLSFLSLLTFKQSEIPCIVSHAGLFKYRKHMFSINKCTLSTTWWPNCTKLWDGLAGLYFSGPASIGRMSLCFLVPPLILANWWHPHCIFAPPLQLL